MKASLPAKVLNFLAQIQLGWANEVQEIHRRNGKAVDKEVRDVLVKRMREGVELTRDQEELLKEINKVVGGEKGWKEFNSSYPGVEMQLKVRLSNRGEERKASLLDINSESLQKCLKRELKSVLLMCSVLIAACLDTQKVFSA